MALKVGDGDDNRLQALTRSGWKELFDKLEEIEKRLAALESKQEEE